MKPEPGSKVTLTDGQEVEIVNYDYGRLNVLVNGVKKRFPMSLLPGWEDKKNEAVSHIPEDELTALRNVTLKEGRGVTFDMGLERIEDIAKAVWPELRTVLVSNIEINGTSQVSEYEGYGYVVLEDGKKSTRTLPGRGWTRMGCLKSDYEAREAERMKVHNSKDDLAGRRPLDGEAYAERQEPEKLSDILARADENFAKVEALKAENLGLLESAGLK